jgi:signal transduction histidine kinase
VSSTAFVATAARDQRSPLRYVASVALLAAMYFGAAKLGFTFAFSGPIAAIVWLPAGVGIAFLYVGGPRLWPGVLIGDLLANDYSLLPWGAAIGQTIGNVLEVVVAAVVLRRLVRRGSPLDTVPGVGSMLAAIAAGTAVSATIGTLASLLGNVIAAHSAVTVWRTWFLGDASGALVVVPLALAWSTRPLRVTLSNRRAVEAAAMVVAVGVLSELAFRSETAVMYIVFPALVWSALRFGQRGATAAVSVALGVAVWNTVHSNGPFHFHSIPWIVLSAQLFIAVAALSTLCIAAIVAEREGYARGLARSRARIIEAADGERRRLERNLHDGAQHRLTALAYQLSAAAEQARAQPEQSAQVLKQAEAEVTLAIDELRELAHGIHPTVLTDLGLANAVRSIATRSVVKVELLELPTTRVDPTAEATAYYVVAEAVMNAQRHANASAVWIRVTARRNALHVVVLDDGIGGARLADGSGLQGLCDRVEAIGGTFAVSSAPGHGTRINAVVPFALE